ncbi:FecR family protein [Mucilaginibacter sp.]|uniref:FecR family protein n=1 Tax=Mucilaginibacter sp. TaxID=1882438 RepID=UPI0035BC337B
MKKPIPVELLEKYLSGNCSPAESAQVQEWYASFGQHPNYIDALTEDEQQTLEANLYNRILENIGKSEEAPVYNITRSKNSLWYKIAGAAAVALIATGLYIFNRPAEAPKETAQIVAAQIITVANGSNHITKTILPDSSVVWLSPRATLKYPAAFAKASRMVGLTGEAFFEVTKNPQRPFIITGRTIITKVWGTSFLVRDNEASHTADVSVVSGKVSVSVKKAANGNLLAINKDEVILYPQQKVTYLTDAKVLKPESIAKNTELKKWKHVDLYFDNKPLKDIVPTLNATYNVNIRVSNEKLNHYMLNADFSGLNLPDVLEALSKALNIDYAIRNNIIELNKPVN